MNQVYQTAQVAKLLGVSDSTIRGYKLKHQDALVEGVHWCCDNGANLWTDAGIAKLRELRGDAPQTPALEGVDTETLVHLAMQRTAGEALPIAAQVYQAALVQNIQRILSNPTDSERAAIQQCINPAISALLETVVRLRDSFSLAGQDFAQIRSGED